MSSDNKKNPLLWGMHKLSSTATDPRAKKCGWMSPPWGYQPLCSCCPPSTRAGGVGHGRAARGERGARGAAAACGEGLPASPHGDRRCPHQSLWGASLRFTDWSNPRWIAALNGEKATFRNQGIGTPLNSSCGNEAGEVLRMQRHGERVKNVADTGEKARNLWETKRGHIQCTVDRNLDLVLSKPWFFISTGDKGCCTACFLPMYEYTMKKYTMDKNPCPVSWEAYSWSSVYDRREKNPTFRRAHTSQLHISKTHLKNLSPNADTKVSAS